MNDQNSFIVGTCREMCSIDEIKFRKSRNLIHYYEKNGTLVKEFSRSAADKKLDKPENLRTARALHTTLGYLFNTILQDSEKPLNFRYDFIFDRCRAVRQEIVIQNFSCESTLKLLEPIVMFLSFSLYKMNGLAIALFDTKICRQHLEECLYKCLTCYEELDLSNINENYRLQNRIIVESIHLMLHIDDYSSLQRAIKLDSKLKSSFSLKTAIRIAINFHQRNFHKILTALQDLPHLVSAMAALSLSIIRKEVFRVFSIGYNSQSLKVPLEFLQRLLIYDEKSMLLNHLRDLGIHETRDIGGDDDDDAVLFSRKKFNSLKSISNTPQRFVDSKLRDFHLPDLILAKNI